MRTEPIGQATAEVTFENQEDLWALERGLIEKEAVRSLRIPSAVVDSTAIFPTLPTTLYRQVGLSRTWPARITILGRDCTMEIRESDDLSLPTIGRLVLASLDLVIDPESRTLVGNPAHGGEWILESYTQSFEHAFPTA